MTFLQSVQQAREIARAVEHKIVQDKPKVSEVLVNIIGENELEGSSHNTGLT